jgi:5-methylcytosine-specific restriction endonuclease McrA
MRICQYCKTEFNPSKQHIKYCSNDCSKKGRNIWWKDWRLNNPDKVKKENIHQYNKNRKQRYEYSIEWREKIKIKLINLLGGKCQICGYFKCIRALEFHHIIPKNHSDTKWYSKKVREEIMAHPELFQLLCSNCHREIEDKLFKNQSLSRLEAV